LSQHHADNTAVADHQNPLPGQFFLPSVEAPDDPLVKIGHGLTPGRDKVDRVLPEAVEVVTILLLHLLSGEAFPGAEADFAQIVFDMQWNSPLFCQFFSEKPAPCHRRADNGIPAIIGADSRLHLLPAFGAQRIILAAPEHLATLRLAVSYQINDGCRHRLTPQTGY